MNDLENAVVLISYPKEAFGLPRTLRAFICTDASLPTQVILDCYLVRWSIEVFFRQAKQKLALDQYQIRSSLGIRRFWVLMSSAYLISCIGTGQSLPFQDGFLAMQRIVATERISFIYHCGVSHVPLEHVLAFAA